MEGTRRQAMLPTRKTSDMKITSCTSNGISSMSPTSAGAPGKAPGEPDALTEIQLLAKAIRTSESDDIKSHDVVWLERLVGDIHQPLHATSRFTKNHPDGDADGNDVVFCERPCRDKLHACWDELLGNSGSVKTLQAQGGLAGKTHTNRSCRSQANGTGYKEF